MDKTCAACLMSGAHICDQCVVVIPAPGFDYGIQGEDWWELYDQVMAEEEAGPCWGCEFDSPGCRENCPYEKEA